MRELYKKLARALDSRIVGRRGIFLLILFYINLYLIKNINKYFNLFVYGVFIYYSYMGGSSDIAETNKSKFDVTFDL